MDAKEPCLRFLIGIMERRVAMRPVYEGATSKVARHEPDPEEVTVFRVLGYGSTLARAQERAQKARW